MYSREINDELQKYNYNIPVSVYLNILNTSPQINHTKYNPYNDKFEIWTDDRFHFEFNVYCNN